ncbi:hypothetical protein C3L29_003940 [Pseudomonas sp. MWU12-2534b]|nr:hypothetical protein C3L29_003940 [Pseudomonas sp. MWU12-2534b]
MKAPGDLQLGIQGEQQRQATGLGGVDVLFQAGLAPDPTQPVVAFLLGVLAQHRGGCVMEELAEGLVAEGLVIPGMQDEFMPQVVHHLGRHRHVALAALEVGQEELAQALGHQLAVLEAQVRVLGAQRFEQTRGQGEIADVGFPAQCTEGVLTAP